MSPRSGSGHLATPPHSLSAPRRPSQGHIQGSDRGRPRTHMTSLSLQSTGQSKSRNQPGFKEWGSGLHLSMGAKDFCSVDSAPRLQQIQSHDNSPPLCVSQRSVPTGAHLRKESEPQTPTLVRNAPAAKSAGVYSYRIKRCLPRKLLLRSSVLRFGCILKFSVGFSNLLMSETHPQ